MDLFGRKRIRELEESLAQKDSEYTELHSQLTKSQSDAARLRVQNEYLVRTIRDMDQHIFNMAQRTNWTEQRPYFAHLHEGMLVRKRAESDRIGDILRGELIDTYAPNMTKQIGKP